MDPPGVSEVFALPGEISVQQRADERMLCLAGEIDLATVGEFERLHGRMPVPVDVIDASGVTFIGSSGIAFLLRWSQASTAAGRAPILRSAPIVDRVLELAGLTGVLRRSDTQ